MKTKAASGEAYLEFGSVDVLHANICSVNCAEKAKKLSELHVRFSGSAAFPVL
jgi:hypothetical protein